MDDVHDYEPDLSDEGAGPRARPGPALYALVGLLVGLVVGFGVAWGMGGNPFSDTNQVVFRELVVASVSEQADQICWAVDPDRRDSPRECAILALDPEVGVPEVGQEVLVGLVEVRTPDGQEFHQVVHIGQPGAAPADD